VTILQLITVEVCSFQLVNALLLLLCNMLLQLKNAEVFFVCLVGIVSSLGRKCLCWNHGGYGALVLPIFIPSVWLCWVSAAELHLLNSPAEHLEIRFWRYSYC